MKKLRRKKNKSNQKKVGAKSHEKRSVARSQLQAISQLASGGNKIADVNAKRLKMEGKIENRRYVSEEIIRPEEIMQYPQINTRIDMHQFVKSSFFFSIYGTSRST